MGMNRQNAYRRRKFNSIRIYTGANISSIISKDQYEACCELFGFRPEMKTNKTRRINLIGGQQPGHKSVNIQITFRLLKILVDVAFLLMEKPIPTLLGLRNIIRNNLEFSLQNYCLTFEVKQEPLPLYNYCLL